MGWAARNAGPCTFVLWKASVAFRAAAVSLAKVSTLDEYGGKGGGGEREGVAFSIRAQVR